MKIKEFYNYIDSLFPGYLSCDWDNDGIMCCSDENEEAAKVLISLDATEAAIKEAALKNCNVLLTHHPLLFKKPSAVCGNDYLGRRIISSIDKKVTVISFHTRLDAGTGGVNDCLVKALGFTASGNFGDDDSPDMGRIIEIPQGIDSGALALLCKDKLQSGMVRVTGRKTGTRIGVVGGAGADFIKPAVSCGCDILVTGECSYNSAQDAAENGLVIIEAGHFETEFPVCNMLGDVCKRLEIEFEIFDSHIFNII